MITKEYFVLTFQGEKGEAGMPGRDGNPGIKVFMLCILLLIYK